MSALRATVAPVNRDRQILDAAAALFYEKGFHGVGVDEIGLRVGISGPALYRHFSGKDEILATLFNEAMDELIGATAAVYDDPHRDLERLIRHHVEFSVSHRHLINVYQREDRSLVDPWRKHFDRRTQLYAARWDAALARCFPDTPAPQIAAGTQAAIGMIHSVAYWPIKVIEAEENLPSLLFRLVTDGLNALSAVAESPAPAARPRRTRQRARS